MPATTFHTTYAHNRYSGVLNHCHSSDRKLKPHTQNMPGGLRPLTQKKGNVEDGRDREDEQDTYTICR